MRIYFAEYRNVDIKGVIEGNIIKLQTEPEGIKYVMYVEIDNMNKLTLEHSVKEAVEKLTQRIDYELDNKE